MADLENRVSSLETKVSVIETKVDMFIEEMRRQNEMRAAEIARVDAKFEAKMEKLREDREKDNAKHEADIKAINERIDAKIDTISKELRGMAIATILGVGAIVAGVMGFAWTMFANNNPAPVQQPAQIQNVDNAE